MLNFWPRHNYIHIIHNIQPYITIHAIQYAYNIQPDIIHNYIYNTQKNNRKHKITEVFS